MTGEVKAFVTVLVVVAAIAMCYCGYLWGVKKTETKYGRLRDDPGDQGLNSKPVMMKQDDEIYDL